jgi:hypothetical protein
LDLRRRVEGERDLLAARRFWAAAGSCWGGVCENEGEEGEQLEGRGTGEGGTNGVLEGGEVCEDLGYLEEFGHVERRGVSFCGRVCVQR